MKPSLSGQEFVKNSIANENGDHTRDLNQNRNENSGTVKENKRSVNKNSAFLLPDQQKKEEKAVTKAVYLKTK